MSVVLSNIGVVGRDSKQLINKEVAKMKNDSYLLPIFVKALQDEQAPEEAIENYKKLFLSSTHAEGLPCPGCFLLHNQRSRLIPLPGDDKGSPVKCSVCKREFYVPCR
jgi:hypothetical protein